MTKRGRPKGSRNRRKFLLTATNVEETKKPTAAQRMQILQRRVVLLIADGMSAEKIAAVMGIPVDRLKQVFAHQLEHGKAILRSEELERLDRQSAEGKTAATKFMLINASGPERPTTKPDANDHDNVTRLALRIIAGGKNEAE